MLSCSSEEVTGSRDSLEDVSLWLVGDGSVESGDAFGFSRSSVVGESPDSVDEGDSKGLSVVEMSIPTLFLGTSQDGCEADKLHDFQD